MIYHTKIKFANKQIIIILRRRESKRKNKYNFQKKNIKILTSKILFIRIINIKKFKNFKFFKSTHPFIKK
jgi:hypothetical protein